MSDRLVLSAHLYRVNLGHFLTTTTILSGIINCCFFFLSALSPCPLQAKLFRLFQEVLSAPPSKHAEELRKLAIYMVRQFVVAAEKNPKIYAELFFWKTIRECNDMENGYEGGDGGGGGKKGWSEEQEDELRRLFEENQANPENDNGNIRSERHYPANNGRFLGGCGWPFPWVLCFDSFNSVSLVVVVINYLVMGLWSFLVAAFLVHTHTPGIAIRSLLGTRVQSSPLAEVGRSVGRTVTVDGSGWH